MKYLTTVLETGHQKKDFNCGNDALDAYIKTQAKQDLKRKLSVCFVAVDAHNTITGYYTLSSGSIPRDIVPEEIKNKMPASYTNLPVTLLGRLAVDTQNKGKGLGELLLMDALRRSFDNTNNVGSMALIVDPIDASATMFYKKYGFISLQDSARLFLPMKTIGALFGE